MSLTSIAMFLYASSEMLSRDPDGDHSVVALFGYIVVCVAYILISALAFVDLPPLERRWFPFAPIGTGG